MYRVYLSLAVGARLSWSELRCSTLWRCQRPGYRRPPPAAVPHSLLTWPTAGRPSWTRWVLLDACPSRHSGGLVTGSRGVGTAAPASPAPTDFKVCAVMPFGCLAIRDGRTYNSLSEITDKYEIGQILRAKEFCELCLAKERQTDKVFICKKFLKKDGKKVRKAAKNEIMILKIALCTLTLFQSTVPCRLSLFLSTLCFLLETCGEQICTVCFRATGGDVFDWILDQGNYTERDASNVIRQVLEAVAYLHSLNIVHRNLKLENLMYYNQNNHNKVVLRDFYLSRFENGSITEPCGTPEYLAPEVVARHRYGRPVDCWAVGVIMYILLSGNPPFYDETEEENTDLHNRIIFCRIVSGEFEFDSPYWDEISPAAKELVCRLMEVDPMLRITAQDALWHEWIAGNGASEKNLKDGVCAQFEKNFAKAKWRKAIRVTTFMQRLRAPEAGSGGEGGARLAVTPRTSMSVSHKVTVESRPEQAGIPSSLSVGVSPTSTTDPLPPGDLGLQPEGGAASDSAGTTAASLGPDKPRAPPDKPPPSPRVETRRVPDRGTKVIVLEHPASPGETRSGCPPDTPNRRKMAAVLHRSADDAASPADPETRAGGPAARPRASAWTLHADILKPLPHISNLRFNMTVGTNRPPRHRAAEPDYNSQQPARQRSDREDPSHANRRGGESPSCMVARPPVGAPLSAHVALFSLRCWEPASRLSLPVWCQTQLPEAVAERRGAREPQDGSPGRRDPGAARGSPGAAHRKTVPVQGQREAAGDWHMDSVIEQIEKQMAAVLEKIEGDMPSLLEQISDRPSPARAPLAPATRPSLPPFPHLTIPPCAAPPPPPPEPEPGEQPEGEAGPGQSQRGL
nr:PREDICTED: caM kinase-like vesicle-associated protein [Lepisosteus oculatus]